MRRWVNMVVVLAVLGCVGLLAVGCVARVRESAESMSCQNNLKMLGIALGNCHDVYDRLPPLADQGAGAPTGTGLVSVHSTLIPYLEATPWYFRPGQSPPATYHAHSSVQSAVHGNKDWTGGSHPAYGGIANQVLWKAFLDPSVRTADKLRNVPMTLPDGSTGYYAAGSYAVNGLLPWGGKLDKSLNTIVFGERPQVCRTAAGDDVYNLWGVGFYSPHMPSFAALAPATLDGVTTGQVAPTADGRVRIGRADAPPQPPDFPTPIQRIVPGRPCDPRLPGTPHRGGMQAVMADCSVRVFTLDTDPQVFWAACGERVFTLLPLRERVGRGTAPDGERGGWERTPLPARLAPLDGPPSPSREEGFKTPPSIEAAPSKACVPVCTLFTSFLQIQCELGEGNPLATNVEPVFPPFPPAASATSRSDREQYLKRPCPFHD